MTTAFLAVGVAQAAAPTATTGTASNIAATSAKLAGSVAPNGQDTTYHFEYGVSTAYGSRTPDGGTVRGNKSKNVSATVNGLLPSTTYHFRLVASNAAGTANGNDATFTTPAAGPNDNTVTIAANPKTIRFGSPTTVAGRVNGPNNTGKRVELDESAFPFTSPFKQVATTTSDASGNYTFSVSPGVNTHYHAVASTSPRSTSPDITVNVRPQVTLKIRDRTPARGQRVRFSGTVLPAHDAKRVRIQRRTSKGWRTITRALLKPATPVNGVARSQYSKRVRITHSGRYRTLFVPGDGDHVRGASARKRVRVH